MPGQSYISMDLSDDKQLYIVVALLNSYNHGAPGVQGNSSVASL